MENWLGDLLKKSRRSVHGVICRAAGAIADINFRLLEFENTFPAQVKKIQSIKLNNIVNEV